MRGLISAVLLAGCTGSLAGCGKGAADLQSALDKWVKETRAGSHYEIGGVSNVSKTGRGYEFDVTVTDKASGQVITSHEDIPFDKDGVAYSGEDKMTPLGFERRAVSLKTITGDPRYAGQTAQGVSTAFYCSDLNDQNPNTFSCTDRVKVVPKGGNTPDSVELVNLMTWDGTAWLAKAPEPQLTDVWWKNDVRSLRFNENGALEITRPGGGYAQNNWKDGGNNTLLIQYPGQRGMSGQWLDAPGPVARCPYKLTAMEFTLIDCDYDRLIGTYHR